ncbi:deoxyguanosinetriphosphate triphosphohydrolase family protein [Actinoplanes sp. ATCC 53533]|uniref:deoxyguanosinetriphosphate triphosphohydrolase family protein n=1 Tax=Actinoplanes sp. ATCC 53533 TaxID=1288362 RepID=UPI0013153522|nr:dNTP triphosphohydrolase [Actinoplanes sp. ATCC 53533]
MTNRLAELILETVHAHRLIGIEDLLQKVGARAHTSKLNVAAELWDLIHWEQIRLTVDSCVTTQENGEHGPAPSTGRDSRARAEKRPNDIRTEARLDRDRVLHSPALHRLAGVTQIVSPDYSGHLMHSRLTHSIKVGQVGRRIADQLASRTDEAVIAAGGGLDADVVEAACLAHDVGHPPFGHAGEQALDVYAREQMDLPNGFEGNAQSFRVLSRLESRFQHHPGLNLTAATLAAVIKYPWLRDEDPDSVKWRKFNAYESDKLTFDNVRAAVPVAPEAQTLEASIMDTADDITYALHDLEDFYCAGSFPRNQIVAVLGDFLGARRNTTAHVPVAEDFHELEALDLRLKRDFPSRHRDGHLALAAEKVLVLIEYTMLRHFNGSRTAYTMIRSAFAARTDSYVRGITAGPNGPHEAVTARLRDDHWHEVQVLKWLTRKFVIARAELALSQLGQTRVLRDTVARLLEWSERDPRRLPRTLYEYREGMPDSPTSGRRAILDYVSSLTDAQLLTLSRTLAGSGERGIGNTFFVF